MKHLLALLLILPLVASGQGFIVEDGTAQCWNHHRRKRAEDAALGGGWVAELFRDDFRRDKSARV